MGWYANLAFSRGGCARAGDLEVDPAYLEDDFESIDSPFTFPNTADTDDDPAIDGSGDSTSNVSLNQFESARVT